MPENNKLQEEFSDAAKIKNVLKRIKESRDKKAKEKDNFREKKGFVEFI